MNEKIEEGQEDREEGGGVLVEYKRNKPEKVRKSNMPVYENEAVRKELEAVELLPEVSGVRPGMFERSIFQSAADRKIESEMYLRGNTLEMMVARLNEERPYRVSMRMVVDDMHVIRKEWRQTYLANIDEVKAKELARIDELEKAYWEGWAKSLEKESNTITEKLEDRTAHSGDKPTYSRTRVRRVDRDGRGDPKMLEGVERCIKLRCKIFGLDAQRIEIMDWRKQAASAGVDPNQLYEDVMSKFLDANLVVDIDEDIVKGEKGVIVEEDVEE